jgi:predicted DNA-binding transcriptional regulator AlpA
MEGVIMSVTELVPLKTPKQAAEILGVSERWLARARNEHFGPEPTRLGHRSVRYSEPALLRFINARTATAPA